MLKEDGRSSPRSGKEEPARHPISYLRDAAGPAAGEQLARGAEAVLIEAGG